MTAKKISNIVTTVLFAGIAGGFFLWHIAAPDKTVTVSERRTLAAFPEFSLSTLESGTFVNNFEKYALDQFPLRDSFRSVKAICEYNVFLKRDNNDIYFTDGYLAKLEYPMKESSVISAAAKFNKLTDKLLGASDVYFAMVPDKNYFLAEKNGYLSMDYDLFKETFYGELSDTIKTIDLFDTLTIEDYYRTDTHWNQENLGDTVNRIAGEMGFADRLSGEYMVNYIEDFYGVYSGQSALPVKPDRIAYLTNDVIESAKVTNLETGKTSVYNLNKLTDGTSMDNYDIFLDGPAALLTIENPGAATDEELILFRDSFGSSIAPLFLEAYRKIYVVDLRYLAADYLTNFIDFSGQDVLFLYSTTILNTSEMIKIY